MTDTEHKAMIAAAGFFNESAKNLLTIEGKLHAETLIASVARMSGSLMFRSFGFDKSIEPGTSVFSDQANTNGPALTDIMLSTLQQLGDNVSVENIDREYMSAKFSQLSFKESHSRLAPIFLRYCEVTPLAFRDAAIGAAIATGVIVHDCREVLSAEKGGAIAVYGFVEGTKTAPFPIDSAETQLPSPTPEKKKTWCKWW